MILNATTELLTEIPPLMLACCEPDNIRYDLGKPFVAEGYLCATNGRILVRQPVEDFEPSLIEELTKDRGKFPRHPSEVIPKCKGDWKEVELTQPPKKPCRECGGREYVACEECIGERSFYENEGHQAGPAELGIRLVDMLIRHGVTTVRVLGKETAVTFTLGRIEGVLMPRTKS